MDLPDRDRPAPRARPRAGGRTGVVRTRRRFLGELAALAAVPGLAGLVSACGSAGDGDGVAAPTVVPLFSPDRVLVAGRPQRIPLAIVAPQAGDDAVALPDDDEAITITIDLDGETIDEVSVGGRVVDHDHGADADPDHQHADLFRYYPLRATLPEPGIYDLGIDIGAATATLPVQIFDPAETSVPQVGDPFPAVTTPTVERPGGVDRLCTRFEPCSLHRLDGADLVGTGRPLALLVATPAFCSTAYCGPVLDTLVEATAGRSDLDAIHVEVYANTEAVGGNYLDPAIRLVPAVEELGLTFEPSLFLVDGDGTLADRIDNVFDRSELDDALVALTGSA